MINMMIRECDVDLAATPPASVDGLFAGEHAALARALTLAEAGRLPAELGRAPGATRCPVLGITGTGGSGKSSLTDELVRRFRLDQEDKLRIAVLAVDPTRRRGGGALLGDRIRMNALGRRERVLPLDGHPRHRRQPARAPGRRHRACCRRPAFDLVIVETPGIGQGDAGIVRVRRPLAVRDDAGVRRRVPAREDRHAGLRRRGGDQQVRAPRRRGRPPRRRPPAGAQPRGVRRVLGGHAGVRHQRRHLQRRRRHRALPAPARAARGRRAGRRRGPAAAHRPQDLQRARRGHPAAAHPLPGRDRRDRARLPRARPTTLVDAARHRQHLRTAQAALEAAQADRGGLDERAGRRREGAAGRRRRAARQEWPSWVEAYSGDEMVVRVRDKELRTRADPRDAVRQPGPPGRAAALHRGRRAAALPAPGEPARQVPVHRRGVPVQAGGRGPGPDVRRRGRRVPHQPAVQATCPPTPTPSGCPPRSTRSRSTGATRTPARTSTARSARPASRSPRSTT